MVLQLRPHNPKVAGSSPVPATSPVELGCKQKATSKGVAFLVQNELGVPKCSFLAFFEFKAV